LKNESNEDYDDSVLMVLLLGCCCWIVVILMSFIVIASGFVFAVVDSYLREIDEYKFPPMTKLHLYKP